MLPSSKYYVYLVRGDSNRGPVSVSACMVRTCRVQKSTESMHSNLTTIHFPTH